MTEDKRTIRVTRASDIKPRRVPDSWITTAPPRHVACRRHVDCYKPGHIWPDAEWITGSGTFASLAYCQVLTVELHPTMESAAEAKRTIDATGCGHGCRRDHEIAILGPREDVAP